MAQHSVGNIWSVYDSTDLFLITTNATLRADGALVMGRGIARQARDRFPGLASALGRELRSINGVGKCYGLLISPAWPQRKLGLFQVKYHWAEDADLGLIAYSAGALTAWCARHPEAQVALNYPGIGNGKLEKEEVASYVDLLPDQVTLWTYR